MYEIPGTSSIDPIQKIYYRFQQIVYAIKWIHFFLCRLASPSRYYDKTANDPNWRGRLDVSLKT